MTGAEFLQRAHHMLAGLCQVAGSVDGIQTLAVVAGGGAIMLVQSGADLAPDPQDAADAFLQVLGDLRPAFAVGGFVRVPDHPALLCEYVCGMYAEDVDGRAAALRPFIMEWRPPVLGWYEWPENLAAQAGLQ